MKTDEMLIIHKIVTIINSNMYQDKYDEWVNHPNPMVRYALVCNDFKPELFIYNNNTMVRSEALKRRPDLQYQALKDKQYAKKLLLPLYRGQLQDIYFLNFCKDLLIL